MEKNCKNKFRNNVSYRRRNSCKKKKSNLSQKCVNFSNKPTIKSVLNNNKDSTTLICMKINLNINKRPIFSHGSMIVPHGPNSNAKNIITNISKRNQLSGSEKINLNNT